MGARSRRAALVVLLIGLTGPAAVGQPLYSRDGSTSDRVVYAYFSPEVAHERISVPVCDSPRGAPAQDCINVAIEQILPRPAKEFDAALGQVIFILVVAAPMDFRQRPILAVGTLIAPNGRQTEFTTTVAIDRRASRHLIQQALPRDVLGAAFGEWMLMLKLDDELVGMYAFSWGDASTAARARKVTEDLLTSDNPPPPPALPAELFAEPPPPGQKPPR